MAFIGLAKPYIAKLVNEKNKTYANGFKCGKAMAVNIQPNYSEAKLYADNQLSEYVKEFKDGTMTLGTDRLPKEANSVCFGHESAKNGTIYKTGDSANFVGVGFCVKEMLDGVPRFVAIIVYKVKFGENAEDYTTKGENIEFKTPSISGTIAGLSSTVWKENKIFDTEEEAEAWIKEVLNIKEGDGTQESDSGSEDGQLKLQDSNE